MSTDLKDPRLADLDLGDGLDRRHISCRCSTGRVAICGSDLAGRTPLGYNPPEIQRCPLCVVLYQATTNCHRCGRRWSGKALS